MLRNGVDVYRGKMGHVKVCAVRYMQCGAALERNNVAANEALAHGRHGQGNSRQRSRAVQQATDGTCAGTGYKDAKEGARSKGSAGSTSPFGLERQVPGTRPPAEQVRRSLTAFCCPHGQSCESPCDTPIECWVLVMTR